MPARIPGELELHATVPHWSRTSQLTTTLLLVVVAASMCAWFVERRVTDLMLADLVARATDQVELGIEPRLTPADLEPPYTQVKLDSLDSRLDPILARARESASGIIRVDLFARDGTVLYSDVGSLQGQVVSPLANQHLADALAGSVSTDVSSLTRPEDADLKRRYYAALEAYVPCILDGRVVGAYEVYTEPGPLLQMRSTIWTIFGVAVALLLVGGVLAVRCVSGGAAESSAAPEPIEPPRAPPLIRTGLIRRQPDRGSDCWLSRREMEVLHLLASKRTYRQMAEELSVSEETVRSHVKSILHKLGQPDRGGAVAAAVRAGIVRG